MPSRIAKAPVVIPDGVKLAISNDEIQAEGKFGKLVMTVHQDVNVTQEESTLLVSAVNDSKEANAQSGTTRANLFNLVNGVHQGFDKKLLLVGVGYRAQLQGQKLVLSLGFSHPVEYAAPEGISFELPSQTEIIVKGANKQLVGQVAANLRSIRPPEPYKGKGVRYADEQISLKETKKK